MYEHKQPGGIRARVLLQVGLDAGIPLCTSQGIDVVPGLLASGLMHHNVYMCKLRPHS